MKKMYSTLLVLGVTLLFPFCTYGSCCTNCTEKFLCDYMTEVQDAYVIRGHVSKHFDYSFRQQAAYFEIDEIYRNDYGFSKKTIKLFGTEAKFNCTIDVFGELPVGETFIIAIGAYDPYLYFNEETATGLYDEIFLNECSTLILQDEKGMANGLLSDGRLQPDNIPVLNYPFGATAEVLASNSCLFDESLTWEDNLLRGNYQIFPNPVGNDNYFKIKYLYARYAVEKISIFSSDGRFMQEADIRMAPLDIEIPTYFLASGMYFVQLHVRDKVMVRKLVIQR